MFKFLFLLFLPVVAWSKPIRIAVIDTGYGNAIFNKDVNLCPDGHADMIEGKLFLKTPPSDSMTSKHGTNVASLIDSQIGQEYKNEYCIVVIRFFNENKNINHFEKSNKAIEYAILLGVDFINYSGGGTTESKTETQLVKKALNKGITFVAAAGNEGQDLDKFAFYPAMSDPRVVVVGNIYENGQRVDSSNYGRAVDMWEMGYQVTAGGITLTGTSQATALATGKLVKLKIRQKRQDVIEHMSKTADVKGRKNGK